MIKLRAILEMFTKGTDKAKKEVTDINRQLDEAAEHAELMNRRLSQTRVGQSAMARAGISTGEYRGTRGITGQRAAEARNFSGMASLAREDTGGLVAAYATLAANLFAVTAAFQALSDAAKTSQLTEGLELMGARGGTSLKLLAKNFKEVTDNAISTADAMRSVAQATSAGISASEIERLGKVARGASLALGRDMSDSIDRLTRGVVKLEPELLDEIGIMVRLDEAVKVYAQRNNIAASSLTNAQRRQAFLNAVLEEGEKKFGDINEQIATNPYDKLSSSLRDFGTELLKIVNTVLVPFIKTITEVPVLGLVIALGVLNQTLAKVLPNLESLEAGAFRSAMAFDARREEFASLIPEAAGQVEISQGKERIEAQKELNRLAANELKFRTLSNTKLQEAANIELFRENIRVKGIINATKEFYLAQLNLIAGQQRVGVETKINLLLKLRAGLMVLPTLFSAALAGISAALTGITLIVGAVAAVVALFKKFFPDTKSQEELKKAKESMKELLDTSRKTREQLSSLSIGEGLDASVKASLAILKNLQEQYELEKRITIEVRERNKRVFQDSIKIAQAYTLSGFGGAVRAGFGLNQKRQREAQLEPLREAAEQIKTIDAAQGEIILKAIEEKKSREEIEALINSTVASLEKLDGINSNILDNVKNIQEQWDKLKLKDLDTGFTKISSSISDIVKESEKLPKNAKGLLTSIEQISQLGSVNFARNLGLAKDIGIEINPEDKKAIEDFIAEIKSIEKLNIDIKASSGFQRLFLEAQKLGKILFMNPQEVQEQLIMQEELAKSIEARLVEAKINEKTLANEVAMQNTLLDIEKKRLDNQRKRKDAEMDLLGISLKEDSLAKSITESARLIEDLDFARRKATNDINALEQTNLELQIQKAALGEQNAEANKNQLDFINRQITANKELIKAKEEAIRVDVETANEALNISTMRLKNELDMVILAENAIGAIEGSTAAEKARLDILQKNLDTKTKELELTKSLADAEISRDRAILTAGAARRGTVLSSQQERDLEKRALEAQLALLEGQKENLEQERILALANADLENIVLGIRLNAAKQELENAIELGKRAGLDVSDSRTQLDRVAEAQGILETRRQKERGTIESTFATQGQIKDFEIEALKTTIDAIPDSFVQVGERLAAAFASKISDSIAAFGLSGGARDFFLQGRQDIISGEGSKAEKEQALSTLRKQSDALQEQQILAEGLDNIFNTINTSVQDTFMSLVDGSKSAKQAFGDMAKSILSSIAQMITQMLTFRLLSSIGLSFPAAAGGVMPAAAGGIIPLATGGIMDRAQGVQGVIKQPTYLVGEGRYNEAVVPLPNGRAIPVQMHGGGSQNNNVAVTVNMTNNGTQTQTEGMDANKLGQAVAAAVQRELVAQKAPGGLLNRYSAI